MSAQLTSHPADAAPVPSRLVYSRAEEAISCPDEEALRSAVASRVGYDAFFPWAKRTVVAVISRRDSEFIASVDLVDERGIRHGGHELRGKVCSELFDALALAVAIAIDPQLLLAGPSVSPPRVEPAPMPPPSPAWPPTPLAPPGPTPTESHLTEARARPLELNLTLGPTAGIGFAPGVSLGGTLGMSFGWRRLTVGLEGFVAPPLPVGASSGGSISSWPAIGTLVPCVMFGRLFACGVAEAGAVFASSTPDGRSTASAWWALGGRIGADILRGDRFFLRARVDGVADLLPARLVFNGATQWTAPPVAGSLAIHAGMRFP